MKIISFSDIHLEYPKDLAAPAESDADLLVLSGDILNMNQPEPLAAFLKGWDRPVIFVPGNHEYYTRRPMDFENEQFRAWLQERLPNVVLLLDESFALDGVNFFGGTMWTDFAGGNEQAMAEAKSRMMDYELIRVKDADSPLQPEDTVAMHESFKTKFFAWLETPIAGPRVVITHHAPVLHPKSIHDGSPLIPAFNSLDMAAVIEQYQPDVWFYGHTHECDRQHIGRTQVISNQLGYLRSAGYECQRDFDSLGAPVAVRTGVPKSMRVWA